MFSLIFILFLCLPNVLEYTYIISIIFKNTKNVIKNNLIKLYFTTIDCTCPCNPADIFSLESFCSLKSGRGAHFFPGFKCRYPPPRDQFYKWNILVTLNYPLKVKFHPAGTLPQSCRISSSLHCPTPPMMDRPSLDNHPPPGPAWARLGFCPFTGSIAPSGVILICEMWH